MTVLQGPYLPRLGQSGLAGLTGREAGRRFMGLDVSWPARVARDRFRQAAGLEGSIRCEKWAAILPRRRPRPLQERSSAATNREALDSLLPGLEGSWVFTVRWLEAGTSGAWVGTFLKLPCRLIGFRWAFR